MNGPYACNAWTYRQVIPLLEDAVDVADSVENGAHLCSDRTWLTIKHLLADLQQSDTEVLQQLQLQFGKLKTVFGRRQRSVTICKTQATVGCNIVIRKLSNI